MVSTKEESGLEKHGFHYSFILCQNVEPTANMTFLQGFNRWLQINTHTVSQQGPGSGKASLSSKEWNAGITGRGVYKGKTHKVTVR